MWELIRCNYEQSNLLEEWLGKGYEPFSVSQDLYHTVIWLKRERTEEEIICEILHQPIKSRQRRSRPATVATKS